MLNPWIKAGWPVKRFDTRWITPGVSILLSSVCNAQQQAEYLRLALEILHYIQKPVIHIGLFNEADLDLVKIAQSVLSMNVS